MKNAIIHDSVPVTLVGGGDFGEDAFQEALALAPGIVAADGGAAPVLRLGHMPRAVIGDFDSIDTETRAAIPDDRLHCFGDQDSTDFDKCMAHIRAPLVIGVGFAGARLDHELAALNTLSRYPRQRCILIGRETVTFLSPPEISLEIEEGNPVSLFPLGTVRGSSEGLRWPIGGLEFDPCGRIGTSNEVTGPVTLRFDAPRMLVLLPRQALAQACARLLEEPSRWPAP